MKLDPYVSAAVRTEADSRDLVLKWGGIVADTHSKGGESVVDPVRLLHANIGFQTELYELEFELLDTGAFHNSIHEEVGDLCWYHALATDTLPKVPLPVNCDAKTIFPDRPEGSFWENPKTLQEHLKLLRYYTGFFSEHTKALVFYGREYTKHEHPIPLVWILNETLDRILAVLISLLDKHTTYDVYQVRQMNIDKLKARYPQRFSEGDANARADKKEVTA